MATEGPQLSYHLEFDANEIQSAILPTATPNDFLVVQDVDRVVTDCFQRGNIVFNEIKAEAGVQFRQHHLYFVEGGPYYQFYISITILIPLFNHASNHFIPYSCVDSSYGVFSVPNKVCQQINVMNLASPTF